MSGCVLTGNLYWGLYSYQAETTVSNCVVSGNARGGLFNTVLILVLTILSPGAVL